MKEHEIKAPYVRVVLALPIDGQGLDDVLDAVRSFDTANLMLSHLDGHYDYVGYVVDSEVCNRGTD